MINGREAAGRRGLERLSHEPACVRRGSGCTGSPTSNGRPEPLAWLVVHRRALLVGAPEHYPLRPDSVVGGEIYERELLRRLPAHGVELEIGLPRGLSGCVPSGWCVTVVRGARHVHWALAPFVYVPWLLALDARRRPDLLRAGSVRVTGPSVLVARRLGVPVVLHQHHLEPRWRRLEAAIMRRADAVITVSEHSRAQLVALGVPAAAIHVVPDGLDPPAAVAPADDAWPQRAGLRLLHVGRLEPRKRPEVAVRALALLVRGGLDASLVLAGEGPMAAELARLATALGVERRVRLEGRVSEERKWGLYDAAALLLFPSELEGFGIVAAEAHARGLPVVAAAGTGTAEVVADGRSGLLVPSTPAAFAAAVQRLSDPAARTVMAAEARQIAARFDWDTCAAAVAEIYVRVASGADGINPLPARRGRSRRRAPRLGRGRGRARASSTRNGSPGRPARR